MKLKLVSLLLKIALKLLGKTYKGLPYSYYAPNPKELIALARISLPHLE